MTREQFKFELDDTKLDYPIVDKVMEVWDYTQKKYVGDWYDCGSLSCRCSGCGCKSQKPTPYCPICGEKKTQESEDKK